jgi:hypothetical protein
MGIMSGVPAIQMVRAIVGNGQRKEDLTSNTKAAAAAPKPRNSKRR